MKIDAFLTCLGYYGISTGASASLEGAYIMTSGITGIFYNQLYSTGAHFINNRISSATIPLVNVYNTQVANNIWSGMNGVKVGYGHSGNFSLIMDVEYSGCTRNTSQQGMVLVSTTSSPSGLNSGFLIGITESHRLYFETSGYTQTVEKELGVRDFVVVSMSDQKNVTFGTYNLDDNTFYKKNVSFPTGRFSGLDLYIGNFLVTDTFNSYTGFSGKVNQIVLFKDAINDTDTAICTNCCLATGYTPYTSSFAFSGNSLTGMLFSGVFISPITGYGNVTGKIVTHNGTQLDIIVPSGITGLVQTGQVAIPLFSGVVIQGVRDEFAFLYDQAILDSFSSFSVYFNLMLSSGDTVEVYTYSQPNTNIGKLLNGIDWPTDTGIIQLIGNGLNETYGVDYLIVRNQISGYSTDDILSYDVITAPSIVTAYSGYWTGTNGSRILMSGGSYFPNRPQYFEDLTNFPNIVKITGVSGICVNNPFYPNFGYDLHMNGQKLISGVQYNVVTSGANGFVVSLSGDKLPQVIFYPIYDPTGGGPIGMDSVDDSELAFIPEFSGFKQTKIDVTGNGFTFGLFTGFGEQIWINGIRQLQNLDYRRILPCSTITGTYNPPVLDFILYDSEASNDSLWNIVLPPTLTIATGGVGSIIITPTLNNVNGYPTNGNCIEVWTSQSISSQLLSPFHYEGVYPYGAITINYSGWVDATNHGTGVAITRYHSSNTLGKWTQTSPMTFYHP